MTVETTVTMQDAVQKFATLTYAQQVNILVTLNLLTTAMLTLKYKKLVKHAFKNAQALGRDRQLIAMTMEV